MIVMGGKIERRFGRVRGNITMGQYGDNIARLGESEDRQVGRLTVIVNPHRIGPYSLHDNKESFTLGVDVAIR
jgi:hypothetical protein